MSFRITKETTGWLTIEVQGRFDHARQSAFRQAYTDAGDCAGIIIDLSGATYIDSAALGMLLVLRERLGDDVQRAIIRGAAGQPLDALMIAHFHRLFTLQKSAQ